MTTVYLATVSAAAVLTSYAYVGYPLALWLLSRFRTQRKPPLLSEWPFVSIIVPVYNEELNIAAKLESLLALDYPPSRRQIVVVSDASDDRTDVVASSFASRGVELLRLPRRAGKTAAENAARSLLRGQVIVNTDASVRMHSRALKPLVASFGDPTVGVASCRDMSVARIDGDPNVGESRYVSYEMWLRRLETRVAGIVGASGCLYAIRRELHRHLIPEALSRDFAAPLLAREHGYRSVAVDNAICYVPRAGSLRTEYRRKVRTITRGLETLWYKRGLLNPFRYGLFAWMLWSHKVCRWLVPWALVVAIAALALLSVGDGWARVALAGIGVAAALGTLGWICADSRPLPWGLALPSYVLAANAAALVAWIKALQGELNPMWEPTRRPLVDTPR